MNAVIYVRVSSRDQVEGTSLESQELACREHAHKHKLNVVRVFVEEGESAKFADRTQLLELLSFCKDKSHTVDTLIVWKLDRFARNVEDHFSLKAALRKLGVNLISVTEPIQADPNGKLMETILSGFAQFDNDIRALRSVQGMQQRLREGIFPWKPPLGYLPPKNGKKTEPDGPDPRRFEPIQKAWRMLATGAYTKADVLRLLRTWGVFGYRGKKLAAQLLDHMFQNPFYAGILRNPWTHEEHRGRHVPMVTIEEFAAVQQVLRSRRNSRTHRRLRSEFPLRGVVRCPSCEWPMTASLAKGRNERYRYYACYQRDCTRFRRSYPAAVIHEEFVGFLKRLSAIADVRSSLARDIVSASTEDQANRQAALARKQEEARQVHRQLQELLTMRTARLITDEEFAAQRASFQTALLKITAYQYEVRESKLSASEADYLVSCLANLEALWNEMAITEQRCFEDLVFPAGYVYRRIQTADRALLFRVLERSEGGNPNVAALVKSNLNSLLTQIRKLFAIVARSKVHRERTPEAA